jgi:hypothetical protein
MSTPYTPARRSCPAAVATLGAARRGPPRRGVVSVLAMLYMVIFSVMALGFYAATTTASQVAANERTTLAALLSAESGTQFLRYHLSALDIQAGLTPDKMFEQVYQQLAERLEPTANLGGSIVGYDGTTISIPQNGYVKIDPSGSQKFRITITRSGDLLVARMVGRSGGTTLARGVEVKFQKANNATAIFNYGVASRGTVYTGGTSTITGLTDPTTGSILSTDMSSTTPVQVFGKTVSGDISVVNPNATVTFGAGTSIGGTNNTSLIRTYHIHKGVEEPRFPDIDTTVYAQYVKNTYSSGMTVLDNCRIPSGTGTALAPLKLSAVTIRGVLYIEGSNVIEFAGNTTVQGVIVSSNNVALNTANNFLNFSGSVAASPISTLPSSYGDERNLTGAFIIAPSYRVLMSGNFGTVSGSIITAQFQMQGNAQGTVKGSVITMDPSSPTSIDGSADIVIASVGTTQYPAGVTFGIHYTNIPGSYLEVPVP